MNKQQGKLKQYVPYSEPDQLNISLNADDRVATTTSQPPGARRLLEWWGDVTGVDVFGVMWGLSRSERKVVFTKFLITLAVLQPLLHGVIVSIQIQY